MLTYERRFHEKLMSAVRTMVVTTGSRRERLGMAFYANLLSLDPEDAPDDLRDWFRTFRKDMTSRPPADRWDNSIKATTRTMNHHKSRRLAEELFDKFMTMEMKAAEERTQRLAGD